MKFEDLNTGDKNTVWNELYKLVEYRKRIKNDTNSLEIKIQELEKKIDTSGSMGCFYFILFLFIIYVCVPIFLIIYTSKEDFAFSDFALQYKETPLPFIIVLFCLAAMFVWFIVAKIKGKLERKKAQKQLNVLKEKFKNCDNEKNIVNLNINTLCNRYSIPTEVVTLKGLLYVKELVETKGYDYNTALSLCLKNLKEINSPSLAEISNRLKSNRTQNDSMLERLILLPFKMGGAFLGVNKETIQCEQRRRYSEKSFSYESSNHIDDTNKEKDYELKRYTFIDGSGNLCESGQLFYDGKNNPCEWGQAFYDTKGNYIEWGYPFYDGKGNYVKWGEPFYDGEGNLINPNT